MEKMWLEFRKQLEPFKVFSIRDIRKMFPGMNRMNLVRWQEKGYLLKIRNGWYCFSGNKTGENIPWLAANLIYQPSYISLHTALSHYNLIPEGVYSTTSITTRKTNGFETLIGNFSYHSVKESIYGFGHTLMDFTTAAFDDPARTRKILIAEPEKAILDFFYIGTQYKARSDMENLRFDHNVLAGLDRAKFYNYLDRFSNRALNDRILSMMTVYSLI